MPLQYEVLHLFCTPQAYLAEIRRLDLPATAPKAKRYQWLWIEEGTVSSLLFVGMDAAPAQVRTFEDAQLRFDAAHGELRWRDGRAVALDVQDDRLMPAHLHRLIHEHLN